jgi:CarboxypepD_reg-like domain/TonB-dependent Receptor Plug Domain
MKQKITLLLSLFLCFQLLAQERSIVISGKITDFGSGEGLIGANVYLERYSLGVVSNQYGFYSLKIPAGEVTLIVSYVGYDSKKIIFNINKDTLLNINLSQSVLGEVVIRNNENTNNSLGKLSIPVATLKKIPMLFGEADLMKALSFTPGVMVGQEGSSGLYVRGGSPEQNLMLLDEAPLYNPSHAFGFLSVFNPDAIKNIDLYKGGFPARFGGRASSVVDITMKDGNYEQFNNDLSVGLLSSRFLSEGPLKRKKMSYMIAARQMNTALVFLPRYIKLWSGKAVDEFTNLWFYDINAKINYKISSKDQLHISLYNNKDFFNITEQNSVGKLRKTTLDWANTTATLRYNRIVTPRLFGTVIGYYSNFNYKMQNLNITPVSNDIKLRNEFIIKNTIQDYGLKASFEFIANNNYTLKTGFENIWHNFYPGRISFIDSNQPEKLIDNSNKSILAVETAVYIENEWNINKFIKTNAGLRISKFNVDSTVFVGVEPRLSVGIQLTSNQMLKFGLSRMTQYSHQLSTNGVGIPNDIWVPATLKALPVISQQIEAGWSWNIGKKNQWTTSIDVYYKRMFDLIDYPQGVDIISNFKQNWQDLILTRGRGRVKGVEWFLQKKSGDLTGWLSYTFSKSERNNVSIVGNYKINKNWSMAANWSYQTGYPITLPKSVGISLAGKPTPFYQYRNNNRMPDYHRLDIAFTYAHLTKKRQRQASWNFGVYNAYNRANPYYLELDTIYESTSINTSSPIYDKNQITKHAIFPILPYVNYQIKF